MFAGDTNKTFKSKKDRKRLFANTRQSIASLNARNINYEVKVQFLNNKSFVSIDAAHTISYHRLLF